MATFQEIAYAMGLGQVGAHVPALRMDVAAGARLGRAWLLSLAVCIASSFRQPGCGAKSQIRRYLMTMDLSTHISKALFFYLECP